MKSKSIRNVMLSLSMLIVFTGCNTSKPGNTVAVAPTACSTASSTDVSTMTVPAPSVSPAASATIKAGTTAKGKPIVIYHAFPIQEAKYLDCTFFNEQQEISQNKITKKEIRNYYEIDYWLYAKGESLGKAKGIIQQFSGEGEGDLYLHFEGIDPQLSNYMAISRDYNAFPRKAVTMNKDIPANFFYDAISEINKKFSVSVQLTQLITIDLDGNNTNEYVISVKDQNKTFSANVLLDSNKKIVAYSTIVKDGKYTVGGEYLMEEYIGDIIDMDQDGIMELIIQQPTYEGFGDITVLKYNQGKLTGKSENYATVQP